MLTKKVLESLTTLTELSAIADVSYQIGDRGGILGIPREAVATLLDIEPHLLPKSVGVYVNYLGGGLRGGICKSQYSSEITGEKKELLDLLIDVCQSAYIDAENELCLNEDYDDDGEMDWNSIGTKAVRTAGILSAY